MVSVLSGGGDDADVGAEAAALPLASARGLWSELWADGAMVSTVRNCSLTVCYLQQ